MSARRWSLTAVVLLASCGTAGSFVVQTLLANEAPDLVVVAACAIGAGIAGVLANPKDWLTGIRTWRLIDSWQAPLGGVLAFWAAPLLALSQRLSDAPTGTETAFFTTSCWGLAVVVAGAVLTRRWSVSVSIVGALASVVGSATLLASWERPSSFSPFVRFVQQQSLMAVAGVVFAVALVMLVRQARERGWDEVLRQATVAPAALGLLLGAVSAVKTPVAWGRLSTSLGALAVFSAIAVFGMLKAVRQGGVAYAGAAFLLVPAALTSLSVLERLTGMHGPDPVRWGSAGAGIALAVAGAVLVLASAAATTRAVPVEYRPILVRGAAFAGTINIACGVAALVVPAIRGEVTASVGEGYHVRWSMYGIETAPGWFLLAASLLAATALFAAMKRLTGLSLVSSAVAVVAGIGYFFTLDTPLHTFTTWIPDQVQQVYGTEYARLVFTPLSSMVAPVALAVAALVTLASVVLSLRTMQAVRTEG